jgi:hypothetical protein
MVLRPSRRRAASCGRPEQRLTTGRRRPRMIPRISTNRREPPARVRSVGTGSGKRRVEVPSAERDTVGSSPEDHVDGSQLSPVRRGRRVGRGRHGRPRPPHRHNPPGSQRDDGDGRLGAMRERLVRCRARLAETLGPRGWEGAAHRARTMPVEETIVRALAALETA